MKIKSLFFILIVTGLVFCDSEKSDSAYNEKTQIEFNEFLSFFPDTVLPLDFTIEAKTNKIPDNYKKFVKIVDSLVFPVVKFKIYDSLIGIIASVHEKDLYNNYFLYVFDKSGNMKSSLKLLKMSEFYQQCSFNINDKYLITNFCIYSGATFDGWMVENGIAENLPGHGESVEEEFKYEIKKDGSLFLHEEYLHTVKDFLYNLGMGDIKEAYKLQKNKTWGDFKKFSSTKAFGGLFDVQVFELKVSYANSKNAKIMCKALYKDSVNNSAIISQDFILEKNNEKWLIVDMKVNEYKRQEEYCCKKFYYSNLLLENFTDDEFDFYLLVVSENKQDKYFGGEMHGKASFLSKNHAVYKNENSKIDFYLHSKNKVEIKETNCSKFRHSSLSFNGIFEK